MRFSIRQNDQYWSNMKHLATSCNDSFSYSFSHLAQPNNFSQRYHNFFPLRDDSIAYMFLNESIGKVN